MPETCPRIQLPGKGFGQYGSGWNFGTPGALGVCPIGGGSCWANAGLIRLVTTAASRSILNDPIMTIPPEQSTISFCRNAPRGDRDYLTLTYFRRTRGRGSPANTLPNLSTAPNSAPLPVVVPGFPP